ncbi:MAG: alpha/beta hydrolase family protein, partial [Planctomycetaceae bacterium]|nr:alpha/beta hydrolase family protein [Planctomycetaceae bacterium]
LDVPPEKISDGSPSQMMRRYLMRQVDGAIHRWRDDYEKRKTSDDIAAYQKRMRQNCLNAIGGLPERTPLKARVMGTVARPGYRVEKIVFQSQPKHYVTALLFLPDATRFPSPRPGVLIPCGHSLEGKGYDAYQSMGALLALNGMVGLVFDPIDQGERRQIVGKESDSRLWGTTAHINVGIGCILLGQNTARFEIWDGMRGIDYLQSRPEVDPKRIGCTGSSGGGTQTSYLMALDDRIGCAAPSCYVTNIGRLLATIGTQDSEQHLFGQLVFGADHADFLMMRAPSPVLLCAATRDFFDIKGTWETFRNAKRLYTRLGLPERVDILEADVEHSYGAAHRQGAARWMSRWLAGEDRTIIEPKLDLLSKEDYQCLPDGMVMKLPGARSVYDLNEDFENELAKRRSSAWATGDRPKLLNGVRRLASVRPLADLPVPKVESSGTINRGDIRIEKLILRPEQGIALPALLFTGPKSESVTLYVHQRGKVVDAGKDGPIERLVRDGNAVLAVDLRGTGQTQATVNNETYNPEYQDAYIAYLLGRSYVGMRAEDILVAARYAAERFARGKPGTVSLIAVGNVGIPALHAAVLHPELFRAVTVRESLVSWANVIHHRLNRQLTTCVVHGGLTHYDLPDLAAVLGKKLTIERPVNAAGSAVDTSKSQAR